MNNGEAMEANAAHWKSDSEGTQLTDGLVGNTGMQSLYTPYFVYTLIPSFPVINQEVKKKPAGAGSLTPQDSASTMV